MGRWDLGKFGLAVAILLVAIVGCSTVSSIFPPSEPEPVRTVQIQQTWQLQVGDSIGTYRVAAGLGDISIELKGGKVYAPFEGRVQPNISDCVIFSSPELPAYLFRMCGLNQPRLGAVKPGDAIGSGQYLHFATLRKLPEGTWTIVEPSRSILEQILTPS